MLTLFIIGITCLASYYAFNDPLFKQKLLFYPYDIYHRNNYYRFISSGFIHADWMHLGFNMWTLYLFGSLVENRFSFHFGNFGPTLYLLLYFAGMAAASSISFMQYKDNIAYRALGASGAVSAVLFVSIMFEPFMGIGLIFIPIYCPGIIFGVAYLAYSYWAARNANDNIGHNAHFFGAIFGVLFILAFRYQTGIEFFQKIVGG